MSAEAAPAPVYDPSAGVTHSPFAGATHSPIVTRPSRIVRGNLESNFRDLAVRWHKETKYWSSATKMAMHPSYQRIIALGEKVIPYILNDLRLTRGHWLWALYILSGFQDPSPDDATFDEAVDAWLKWGTEQYGAL